MPTETQRTAVAIRSSLGDRLLVPTDDLFHETASVALAGPAPAPAIIAQPRTTTEVAAIVRIAAESSLPLAVRGAGHSYTRRSSIDGGIVLDTRLMDEVAIDSISRVAVARAGVTAGGYMKHSERWGLTTGFGDTPTVGVVGLTLGGGMGHLSRRDGLTLDNPLEAEVVLADGSIVRTSQQEHPDLFWALRGGGGTFGVVTELHLRLRETEGVTGGLVIFPGDPEIHRALIDAGNRAPETVSSMINILKGPPAPFLPAELHGKPIVVAVLCHSGKAEHAADDLEPFRSSGAPIVDMVKPQPYTDMFLNSHADAGLHVATESGFIDEADEDWSAAAIRLVAEAPSDAIVNLRIMGGAIKQVSPDSTAFAHRDRAMSVSIAALSSDPLEEMRAWVSEAHGRLRLGDSAYVNFLSESTPAAVRQAYPAPTLKRLASVKRRYDPHGVFRAALPIEI